MLEKDTWGLTGKLAQSGRKWGPWIVASSRPGLLSKPLTAISTRSAYLRDEKASLALGGHFIVLWVCGVSSRLLSSVFYLGYVRVAVRVIFLHLSQSVADENRRGEGRKRVSLTFTPLSGLIMQH